MKNMLMLSAAVVLVAATSEAKTGIYAGGQLGFMKQAVKMNADTGNNDQADNRRQAARANLSGMSPGVFVGYSHAVTDDFIIAAELAINGGSHKAEMTHRDADGEFVKASAKRKMDFNPAVMLKYKVQENFVPYIKLGLDIAKNEVRMTSRQEPGQRELPIESKSRFTSVRFAPGLGVESVVSDSVSVRGEYSCAMGTKKKSLSRRITANQTFKTDYALKSTHFMKFAAFYTF